jgi:adhesin/invasin
VVAEADPVPENTRLQPAGDSPRGPAATLLPDSVGVHVTDAAGVAAADVPLTWAALDGGKIQALSTRTDSVGLAWARWTLGPKAGIQRARVQLGNPRTMPPFTITAVALAETPESATLISGNSQQGKVGAELARPVVAALTDRHGNAVSEAVVRVEARDGSVSDTAPSSDAQGRIQVRWTLGSKSGPQTLEIIPAKSPPIRVTAHALPLEAANITPGTLPATAPAGRALPKPVAVVVTDAYGNVIPDAQVVFTTTGGSAAPARIMTDAKGQAATRWTLGPAAGDQVLTATVRGTSAKTTMTVEATRGTSKAAPAAPKAPAPAPRTPAKKTR